MHAFIINIISSALISSASEVFKVKFSLQAFEISHLRQIQITKANSKLLTVFFICWLDIFYTHCVFERQISPVLVARHRLDKISRHL